MSQIAFIMGDQFIYWHALILVLAALCTALMFWALELRVPENRKASMIAVPLAAWLCMMLARFFHWYCLPQAYNSMGEAMRNFREGGFALIGVFLGGLLTALILRLTRAIGNLPAMLDHLSLAGCLGIAVGRLGDLFTSSDRGMPVPRVLGLPWGSELYNVVSGETEVRLAVFMLQAMVAAALFTVLMIFYMRGKGRKNLKDGETTLLFLLCYCASQAVLDSPRYDSLYFRSNGFVSVVQIASILTVLGILIAYTCRLFRSGQAMKFLVPFMALPLMAIAGYMEYYVQRHGGEAFSAYTVMSIAMVLVVVLGIVTRHLAMQPQKQKYVMPGSAAE